jgi:hypothetical protein
VTGVTAARSLNTERCDGLLGREDEDEYKDEESGVDFGASARGFGLEFEVLAMTTRTHGEESMARAGSEGRDGRQVLPTSFSEGGESC